MLSNLKKYHIILASKSPRRQELLRGMGVVFEILTKETPENYPSDLPLDEVPKYLSLQKSLAFKDNELPVDYLLITSDTVVICEGEILGKPKDWEDASRMLQLLSGKTHHVVTGVTVRSAEKTESFAVRSNVTFAQLDDEENSMMRKSTITLSIASLLTKRVLTAFRSGLVMSASVDWKARSTT